MATVSVHTAARSKAVEDKVIVNAEVIDDELIITRKDGSTINAGPVGNATSGGLGNVKSPSLNRWEWADLDAAATTSPAASYYSAWASGNPTAHWYERANTHTWEGGVYKDHVYSFGYNMAQNGSRHDTTEPQFAVQMESKFRQAPGSPYLFEFNWDYRRPNQTQGRRALQVLMEHVNNLMHWGISADTFGITDATNFQLLNYGAEAWFFGKQIVVSGNPAAPAGTTAIRIGNNNAATAATLQFDAPAGQINQIQFRRGGANSWWIYDANSPNLYVRDAVNGRMMMTLVPHATVLNSQVDLKASLRFSDATLFQTTVGPAGAAAALPATPTEYLRFYNAAGQLRVIPCYAQQ